MLPVTRREDSLDGVGGKDLSFILLLVLVVPLAVLEEVLEGRGDHHDDERVGHGGPPISVTDSRNHLIIVTFY